MFKKHRRLPLFAFLSALLLTACQADDSDSVGEHPEAGRDSKIVISAAASLTDALEEIKAAFQKEDPTITITYNFGGSGNLAQQIQQGAPVDIFLSASKKDMDTLSEKRLILENSRFNFVSNKLVIITAQASPLQLADPADIAALDVSNIVLGNTETVPVGHYGKESLESIGIWEEIQNKIVYVSDARQVLTQVETGNAELGIVYYTDALQSEKIRIVKEVDASLHTPIIYPAAIVKDAKNTAAAMQYLDFLASEEGKHILQSYGFITN